MILQKLFFYPDLVLKNVLSISYQSYRPQLYNGSVNDPASRYHVCLQDCSVSECVCVHFAGSLTTLYRLLYIYICLCVNISGHACGLVFVCTSMWMCVGEMWVCVWVSYCGLILRGGSTGGGIWNTGSLRSAWKKPQIKWRTFTAAAPLHCPATGQGWALAVNNTHLTLSLSLSPSCSLSSCPLWRCVADPSLSSLEQKAL